MKILANAFARLVRKPVKLSLGLVAIAALSACAGTPVETTRNAPAPIDSAALAPTGAVFDVRSVVVEVPRSLKVSESKRLLPRGDIVWRDDPKGDRYAQVAAIFQNAMEQGVEGIKPGSTPAILRVEVTRFHALSERARATIGGVHNIEFKLSMHDPATGRPYSRTQTIKANLKAFGGKDAKLADRIGQTQKVRITDHLIEVLQQELTTPQGYEAKNLGIIGAITEL